MISSANLVDGMTFTKSMELNNLDQVTRMIYPAGLASFQDVKGNFTFTLFPNPSTSTVRIETDEAFSAIANKRLLVTDLNGKTLFDRPFTERAEEIDFSTKANGEYLVKVIAGGQVAEWKVVKL